ncbi:MAG: ADP-ribosylation factor-like protein [Candidatus Thorarchaeota archaeon]
MSDWVSHADISARLGYKILLAGLSEAGKTAVKRIFFLKQSTADVDSLGATINYERMTMNIKNTPVTIVDLGGQKIFLKRFLNNFSPFVFSSVRSFIFLIDVANKTSRNSAIQYFCGCLERLEEFSPKANVFVFLHKNDLVRNLPNYESIHSQLKEQFQLEYKTGNLPFFRTTIYKPETVIRSFGRIFELSSPELAESEFVDHERIGTIEEYVKESMVIRKEVETVERAQLGGTPQDELPLTPFDATVIRQSSPSPLAGHKTVGKSEVLSKLQNLMRDATKVEKPKEADDLVLDKLQHLMKKAVKPEGIDQVQATGKVQETMVDHREPLIEDVPSPSSSVSEVVGSDFQVEEEPGEITFIDDDKENQISHLISFYDVEKDQAVRIVELGYADLFESVAATSAVDIPLIIDVLLKYLPLISHQVDVSNLNKDRLFLIFFAIMKGDLQREILAECLILAASKPDLSIDEVIAEIKKEKTTEVVDFEIPKKEYETSLLKVPLAITNTEGVLSVPELPKLGFKCVRDNSNFELEFQRLGEPDLDKRIIGHTTVAPDIKPGELTYLLAYESNLFSMGFFDGLDTSIDIFARLIYKTIERMKTSNISSSESIEPDMEITVPIRIEMDGDFILIPEGRGEVFSVQKTRSGFDVLFKKDEQPLGKIQVSTDLDLSLIHTNLKERIELPLRLEKDWDLASRIIYGAINVLKQASEALVDKDQKMKPEELVEEVDESSEKLKEFLRLLQE